MPRWRSSLSAGGLRWHLGYGNLLEILKNRKHPEHREVKRRLGRPFDPEAFDVGKANDSLSRLKWPRVTESQLRNVLMVRDGY